MGKSWPNTIISPIKTERSVNYEKKHQNFPENTPGMELGKVQQFILDMLESKFTIVAPGV